MFRILLSAELRVLKKNNSSTELRCWTTSTTAWCIESVTSINKKQVRTNRLLTFWEKYLNLYIILRVLILQTKSKFKMNYNLVPKLEDVVAVGVAIEMWKQSDVRHEMIKLKSGSIPFNDLSSLNTSWKSNVKKIGRQLLGKVAQFPVPVLLHDKVKTALTVVEKEMIEYVLEMFEVFIDYTDVCWMDCLCWTPFGTIDKKRTTEAFLERGVFTVQIRYKLACEFICEDYVSILWKMLPENLNNANSELLGEKHFVNFWTSQLQSELVSWYHLVDTLDDEAFAEENLIETLAKFSISKNNLTAFSYFWKMLSGQKKEENLIKFAKWSLDAVHVFSMVTIFLLSEMNSEQQMKLFETHSYLVVWYLDFWLFREFFLPTVEKVLDSMSGRGFCRLLQMTAKKMNDKPWEVEKYQKWFLGLWTQSPNRLKKYLIAHPPDHLYEFLGNGNNFKFITLILDEATVEERRFLFKTSAVKQMCESLMMTDRWEFVVKVLTYSFPCQDEVRDLVRTLLHNSKVCADLILKENFFIIGKLLNSFDDLSHERIVELKRQLVFEGGKEVCKLLVDAKQLRLIDMFLIWGMLNDEEIEEFKHGLLTNAPNENGENLCLKFLSKIKLQFADELVRFCFSSKESIGEFKRELMLSGEGIRMFTRYADHWCCFTDGDCGSLVTIFKWFNVEDNETVEFFFQKFEEDIQHLYGVVDPVYCEKLSSGLHRMIRAYELI